MAGFTLIQILMVAFAFGNRCACGQDSSVLFYAPEDPAHSGIYFPMDGAEDPVNRRVANVPRPSPQVRVRDRPPCAQVTDPTNLGASPCEKDAQYNEAVQNYISRLLSQSQSVNEIVHDPMLKVILNDTLTPFEAISPTTRFGGFRETPVCAAQEELIFPQRAKTPKDDWVFVVNQQDVKQALRVEKCIGEGKPCNFGIASTRDVSTVCRQKYVYRRMLVLGSNNIQPEEVLMPSCCVCYSRKENFDVETRINLNNNSQLSDPEDPVPNRPSTPTGNPADPINFNSRPQNSPPTSALRSNRGQFTSFGFNHTPVRRGAVQQLHPFLYQTMGYR